MNYKSTRSNLSASDIEAVLQGLAPDGGLYVLPEIDKLSFDWHACLDKSPLDMAEMILAALLPGYENMGQLVKQAYDGKFDVPELCPVKELGEDYVLELFHGPTSAFKDVALSMLPRLISAARAQQGSQGETVILTATSGDTGKAALEGFHDVPGTRIVVFYPEDGVSPIQKAQMVKQQGANVRVCAVRGNFDDCQQGVKQAFARIEGEGLLKNSPFSLSSANSINIGRLAPQLTYYFIAYSYLVKCGRIEVGEQVDFSVPTGNFGDILAGVYAKLLGLPVGKLICASNANRVLTDFINSGVYDKRRDFLRTSSPSMDILVSSNLERYLFHLLSGNSSMVKTYMELLANEGCYKLEAHILEKLQDEFAAYCCDENQTSESIKQVYDRCGYVCDPHTAVGWYAAQQYKKAADTNNPMVILSTASPFKFPEAVLSALGQSTDGSDFEKLRRLEKFSGVSVPHGLAVLEKMPVLHTDVVNKDEIIPYILKWLGREV